jgi:hypothetical protein
MQVNQNLEKILRLKVIKLNLFYYLQKGVFFILVLFLIFSYVYDLPSYRINFFPWVGIFLILTTILLSYLRKKYTIIGELICDENTLNWSRYNLKGEVFLFQEAEICFLYNSFAGEFIPTRVFLNGDKRSDGSNNFFVIREGNGTQHKFRILIESDYNANTIISYLSQLKNETNIKVKIKNRMYWL